MLAKTRRDVIEKLWGDYYTLTPHVKLINTHLNKKNIALPTLDHLAIIDLPGPNSGIPELQRIFTAIGYDFQGTDYLPEKQNDFAWLADVDSKGKCAKEALPQIVVADFRLDEMPTEIRNIISHYSYQAPTSPTSLIEKLAHQVAQGENTSTELLHCILHYCQGRDWVLPTVKEFLMVQEFNELLAWVLVFGRRPNHFTYSIHLMPEFESLTNFHQFIVEETGLSLNHDGGIIKGNKQSGIEQGSTAGTPEQITLADGHVSLPVGFVEFVWRFSAKSTPYYWEDYFTGFVANHANRVIQSLYTETHDA